MLQTFLPKKEEQTEFCHNSVSCNNSPFLCKTKSQRGPFDAGIKMKQVLYSLYWYKGDEQLKRLEKEAFFSSFLLSFLLYNAQV